MYSSYTTLQRAQLAKQEYLDTQEVFLGIYAPGRNAALKASLQDQLHRKFLLTDSLRSLEEDGIITRTVYPEVPPRVEYALSDLGESMRPIISAMEQWGLGYQKKIKVDE